MARVRVRVRVAVRVAVALQCLDAIYSVNRQEAVNTREECHWSHACKSFKRRRKGVNLNGILEYKLLPKNAHRTKVARA
jgi:hypothetical protein